MQFHEKLFPIEIVDPAKTLSGTVAQTLTLVAINAAVIFVYAAAILLAVRAVL